MFEMKNESDRTATKNKNEDFLKELDKDRTEKGCEYAVLVSLLEPDSELYNTGIVDVFHRYPKMYVVRPQFFLPIITLLRNAAMNSLKYKSELALVKAQNIDITNFETELEYVQVRLREELRPRLQALPNGDRRDRQVDRPSAEDEGGPARHRSEPSSCERQGAGRDDQEADARQPDDGRQVC